MRRAVEDDRGDGRGRRARHHAGQDHLSRHADGRRLRPARPPRRGVRPRRGGAVERREEARQDDVDARRRRPQRALQSAVGALPARRLRRLRQADRVPSSQGLRRGDRVPGPGAVRARRRAATASRSTASTRRTTTSPTGSARRCRARAACAPRACAASRTSPTSSPSSRSWTSSRASAAIDPAAFRRELVKTNAARRRHHRHGQPHGGLGQEARRQRARLHLHELFGHADRAGRGSHRRPQDRRAAGAEGLGRARSRHRGPARQHRRADGKQRRLWARLCAVGAHHDRRTARCRSRISTTITCRA